MNQQKKHKKGILGWVTLLTLSFLITFTVSPVRAENEDIKIPDVENEENVVITGEKPEGSGTVIDYVKSGDREFYTVMTDDDAVYYLVIDKDKETKNVYYLKEINNADLEKNPTSVNNPSQTPKPDGTPNANNQGQTDDLVDEEVVESEEKSYTLYIAIGVFVLIGGIGYYSIILKSKKEKKRLKEKAQDGSQGQDGFDDYMEDMYDQDNDFEDDGH